MKIAEIEKIEDLTGLVGQELAVSDWIEVTQEMINHFAEATKDMQWIHIDVERAKRESPFGGPIAHGFLTLSLIPYLDSLCTVIKQPFKLTVNQGVSKLRFMAAVRAGARVRVRKKLASVSKIEGGWRTAWKATVDIENEKHPALVAELVMRYIE